MRVLLTGASGFLGRYVLASLNQRAIDTVVVGRHLPKNVSSTNFIKADLLNEPDFGDLVAESGATL